MHLSPLLLLPLLVVADQQVPLKDQAVAWFEFAKEKASGYIARAAGAVPIPDLPNPIDAGAALVTGGVVERINVRNWQRKMAHKADMDEEWMVYLTGGNKSCFGKCGPMNTIWNESVPLLAALSAPAGSPRLKLGLLDCEKDEVLCTAWASGVPVIYHFLIPQKSTPEKPIPLHIVPLNMTTTEVSDIVAIPSAGGKATYLNHEEYSGIMHPFDGILAKVGLLQPFGYFMWALGSVPGWVMMLGISFFSRQIMSRRMAGTRPIPEAAPAGQAAPAPRVAPASGAQPKAPGSAKKRK